MTSTIIHLPPEFQINEPTSQASLNQPFRKNLKLFKKLKNKSSASLASAYSYENLTFRLFHSKTNLNYFNFDLDASKEEENANQRLGFLTSSSLSSSTISSSNSNNSSKPNILNNINKMNQDDANPPTNAISTRQDTILIVFKHSESF